MQNSFSLNDEVIDVEWCAKNGHSVPQHRKYRILIDRQPYVVEKECMTGAEVLELAGKKPSEYQLRENLRGGKVITIEKDQKVCFTEPGVEKFKTLPRGQTEGSFSMRRQFTLLDEDERFLNGLELPWEAVNCNGVQWAFVHSYPIIQGYNVQNATVAIRFSPGYPTTQLDMAYFNPGLSRIDGQPIGALTALQLDGKTFQQWSRHRTPNNPWRPGIDNLSTHLAYIDNWLFDEFIKRPNHAISA